MCSPFDVTIMAGNETAAVNWLHLLFNKSHIINSTVIKFLLANMQPELLMNHRASAGLHHLSPPAFILQALLSSNPTHCDLIKTLDLNIHYIRDKCSTIFNVSQFVPEQQFRRGVFFFSGKMLKFKPPSHSKM